MKIRISSTKQGILFIVETQKYFVNSGSIYTSSEEAGDRIEALLFVGRSYKERKKEKKREKSRAQGQFVFVSPSSGSKSLIVTSELPPQSKWSAPKPPVR